MITAQMTANVLQNYRLHNSTIKSLIIGYCSSSIFKIISTRHAIRRKTQPKMNKNRAQIVPFNLTPQWLVTLLIRTAPSTGIDKTNPQSRKIVTKETIGRHKTQHTHTHTQQSKKAKESMRIRTLYRSEDAIKINTNFAE